ncbi:probable protein phosphatase 2C 33, partial [Tanacetum coccineum]
NFGSRTDTVFCGVFDGHGPFGHMVAKRVRDSLPLKLSAHVEVNKKGPGSYIGNVGDSRAILGTRDVKSNSLVAVQLTIDLKPNLPDEPDVTRVWLPNNDSPGLAMARAFGDFCLKDFGLILGSRSSIGVIQKIVHSSVVGTCRALVWENPIPDLKSLRFVQVVCLFLTPHPNNISTASATEFDTSTEKKEPVSSKPSDAFPGDITDADDDLPDDELAEDPSTNPEDKIDWSALEGVSRVNTLLTLPRMLRTWGLFRTDVLTNAKRTSNPLEPMADDAYGPGPRAG